MTLRLRLALGAAMLAAISAISVASIVYFSGHNRVNNEVRNSTTNLLRRFQDPSQHLSDAICKADRAGDRSDDVDTGLLSGAPGITLECRSADDKIITSIGPRVPEDLASCTSGRIDYVEPTKTINADGGSYATSSFKTQSGFCVVSVRNLATTQRSLDAIRNRSAYVATVTIVVAGLGGFFVARRSAMPIEELTVAAERIATTLDLNAPLPQGGTDEVGRLASAFATMIGALNSSRNEQQHLLENVEHELRTPLTSLRTNIDTLSRHANLEPAMQERILKDVKDELEELSTLVDEVVLLGRDSRSTEPMESLDLNKVADGVVDRWRQRSGREIDFVADTDPQIVTGRFAELSRAISNLIDNALKFTAPDSNVEVRVNDLAVEVRDHGKGIAPGDADKIFDRFYRAVDARSKPGSGLGLAIVALVADSHDAKVSATNHPDGGAVFRFDMSTAARTE